MLKMNILAFWCWLLSCFAFYKVPNSYSNNPWELEIEKSYQLQTDRRTSPNHSFVFIKVIILVYNYSEHGREKSSIFHGTVYKQEWLSYFLSFSHRFKAKFFYNLWGRSARPSVVNLGMLQLSYRFQTFRDQSFSC